MKHKIGDRVKIRSLDWYNANKDRYDEIDISPGFIFEMAQFCSKNATITHIHLSMNYSIDIDGGNWSWTDDFFDELKEERRNKLNKLNYETERNSQED